VRELQWRESCVGFRRKRRWIRLVQIYINGNKAHFTLKGATQMAQFVTQELVHIGSPLGSNVN
jgi:hypothetical protein